MNIELEELEATTIASVRLRVTLEQANATQQKVLGELFAHFTTHGFEPASAPIVIYHDVSGPELDLEIGLEATDPVPPGGSIDVRQLEGETAAVALHVGPYATLDGTRQALMAWVQEKQLQPSGPLREVYETDPCEVRDEAEWRTKVILPVSGSG